MRNSSALAASVSIFSNRAKSSLIKDLSTNILAFKNELTSLEVIGICFISKMLLHTKISTTMLNAKVTQLKIDRDMQVLREKLNNYKIDNTNKLSSNIHDSTRTGRRKC